VNTMGAAVGSGSIVSPVYFEIDVPLNASGQMYEYTITATNVTTTTSFLIMAFVGYYMGD
jgi:hypothetical protein